MNTSNWSPYPDDNSAFDYAGSTLHDHWDALHRGDCEPWPDADRITRLEPDHPDPEAVAEQLADAWRSYHRGDFAQAVDQAEAIGPIAHAVANKAAGIYADYLEDDDKVKLAIYQDAIKRAESAIKAYPNDANAHYFHAFALGRYSQCISITQALAQGVGGRIRTSLEATLKLAPKHAEALTAFGLYHAEIIDKVGKLVGSMTYGASADKAIECFRKALEITPEAPIAHMEYGNGLYLLYGDKKLDESNAAYAEAADKTPIDAMQALDRDYAAASLE
jgi:tetratricopeptide (TPR) repeat protein